MTKLQKLAQQEATLKAQLATLQRTRQTTEKRQRQARRLHVGTLVDHAGLLDLDDAVLRPLLKLLATLCESPDPVAVLEAVLGEAMLVEAPGQEA